MTVVIAIVIAVAFLAVILLAAAIRILREYERAVVFRLGRLIGAKGPGLILLIPVVDRMVRVDLRTVTLNIAAGGHHARQRAGSGERRRVLPRGGRHEGDRGRRGLPRPGTGRP